MQKQEPRKSKRQLQFLPKAIGTAFQTLLSR